MIRRIIFWGLLLGALSFSIAPFLWQFITSIKTGPEIAHRPVIWWPKEAVADNYVALFARRNFSAYLFNSFIVAATSTIVCLIIGSLAAYASAKLRMKGSKPLLVLMLSATLVPPIILLTPLYEMMRNVGLINTYLALILPYSAINLPFTILVLDFFFRQIPQDIVDAALIDGFSRLGLFQKIMIPLALPALATTAILVFIFCWNEFLFALTFITTDSYKTVPVAIAGLSGVTSTYEIPWGMISSAIIISTLPLVLVVFFFQRQILQGLTAGSIK